MSLDLFSSIDFYFSNFSFFSKISFLIRIILVYSLIFSFSSFLKKKRFFYISKKKLNQNLSSTVKKNPIFTLFLFRIFFFLLARNISGLFPFVFGWTAHIIIILLVSLFIWLSLNLRKAWYNIIEYTRHFTPQGVPFLLGLFLAKIELIRNFIRPLTLSLRLGIKITTGHVLLALIRVISILKFSIIIILLGYFLFELFVMFIQAIVYTLLLSQYLD